MNKITPQDIQKGVESVSASPESTYYITLDNLNNGDELCLAFGMGEGFDEPTVCAKIAVLAGNSAMSDYEWDFVMPYEPKSGNVWDTEVSNPGESDAEWFNTQAAQIARKLNNGRLVASACGKKKGKKKPVTSGNLSMKERAANREFEKQQKEHYAKPGTQRALEHHNNKVGELYDYVDEYYNGFEEVYTDDGRFEWSIEPTQYANYGGVIKIFGAGHDDSGDWDLDDFQFEQDLIWDMLEAKPWKGHKIKIDKQGDTMYVISPTIEEIGRENIDDFFEFLRDRMYAIARAVEKQMPHRKSLNSSRRPIQSMYVTEDISGNDLYTCLWSGGKDQFDSMIEDGADPDDILNACEELLFHEDGDLPTMTDVNDLIWFESDFIRERLGISNEPIESGCHGKSKKKGKKKAVKSAAQISEIHNATSDCFVRITRSDVPEVGKVNDTIPLYEFKDSCRSYAETTNGSYYVTMDNTYEGEYFVEFSTGDTTFAPEDQRDDPYYNESLGTLQFEVIWNPGQELCNYLND